MAEAEAGGADSERFLILHLITQYMGKVRLFREKVKDLPRYSAQCICQNCILREIQIPVFLFLFEMPLLQRDVHYQ
jgi:hypothetical protein